MFTGIIEQTGTLVSLTDRGGVRRITVEAPGIASRLREGDSLGVSGVCLTALDRRSDLLPRRPRPGNPRPHLARLARARRARSIWNCPPPPAARSAATSSRAMSTAPAMLTALDPVIPHSSPRLRPRNHRLDPQSPRPGKRPQWMVPQRLRRRRRHQPDDRRLRRRRDLHRHPASHLLAHQSAHALPSARPMNIEADVLVKLAAMQMQHAKKPAFELTEAGSSPTATDPAALRHNLRRCHLNPSRCGRSGSALCP